ncbi:PIG-L family deacetylase [Granulicella arctica]|uniref:LmbE family N-acetylglucosaminyl deacetylase n=1 Tax=Granulicella arctica TaxID=940613 RepID=A0A7Y9PIK1_9BACT|nr:PIG-L family deacetylase [Granulicella arctica]NYF80557.1 LmbE family N-acetylglucosaminyl deacetylase [Granulicella arctica]
MANFRGFFQTAVVLAIGAAAQGQSSKADPANLAAERVQPSVTMQNIAANQGSAALWQTLTKLRTRASLMMIVAHPDDEDGGMLTYESRGQGVHTAMLTLTRGEGGQNIMSGDFNDALGLVRTQELLAADRYLGVDQLWGTEVDFGFSKTKEESFSAWSHDRVLYDAVRAVRLYRPLVITAVFIGGLTDGHGQHQVSGEIAQEVFEKAGDPNVFPDQIKAGLEPWKPLKVYARVPFFSISSKGMYDYATGKYAPVHFYNYVTKESSTTPPMANVSIPEGTYSPILGMTYVQFARMGLGLQKTQNGGMGVPSAGQFDVAYHRYGSHVKTTEDEKTFFDGIDTSLTGIASLATSESRFLKQDLAAIEALIQQAVEKYSVCQPQLIAPLLHDGLHNTDALIAKIEASNLSVQEKFDVLHELHIKRVQFNAALVESLGLSLRAQVAPEHENSGPFAQFRDAPDTFVSAVPGQKLAVQTQVVDGSGITLTVRSSKLTSPSGTQYQGKSNVALDTDHAFSDRIAVTLPADTAATRPPFVQANVEQAFYTVADPALRNASLPPYPLTAKVTLDYNGTPIELEQVVQTAHRVTGLGTVYEPLVIVPAISISVSPGAGIVPLSEKTFMLTAHVRSNVKGQATGSVHLELPEGWHATPEQAPFTLAKDGDSIDLPFTVTPEHLTERPYTMTAVASFNGQEFREGYKTVGYAGLLPDNIYRPAIYSARGVDVKVAPELKVGYLPGTGDDVSASLENLGIHTTTLTMADLTYDRLAHFDAVVLGVRAYAAYLELPAATSQLLAYARAGGVVIVQYNSGQYDHNFGPYPYVLGEAERVVDETDSVKLLHPEDPLLTWPNHITPKDFDGWVEERGHGFMESWDPHYTALTETHDPGQDPQQGGLLYAKTGKGAYIYVAYALYRQLPEGVPGAYRLFANLLSLDKNPHVTH